VTDDHGNAENSVRPGIQAGRDAFSAGRDLTVKNYVSQGMPQPVARSAYLEQVRQIAPAQLHGREIELAELAAFCFEPDQTHYAWWRAEAWTGKSALMSWFVLHPPPGVQVLSFFITARYAGQNDRIAFTEVVLEQLCDVLGQSMPAYLTAATREAHLLGMLAEAAATFRQRKQQLVLVVDGLDEDTGVTIGPDAHSIAALLPTRPPAGLKIIVAGRPDPPIPADVPDNHPLRNQRIVRILATTAWAEVVKADMQRELKVLLHGTALEQDLLGLVTAAGGGLSGSDLAELTRQPVYDVQELLRAVTGRTFASRAARWQSGTVHVLGHEELQVTAVRFLGDTRLAGYRERLHAWADEYRQRGWPVSTPEYLLRGYYRLLHTIADIPRIVECAADQIRHDRMLDVTGGDFAALAEISDAQAIVLNMAQPDLIAMARLAVRRTSLIERNANLPVGLPALWALVGQSTRAESLARSIIDPYRQAQAMAVLAQAVATGDDLEMARILTQRTETVICTIGDSSQRNDALMALVSAVAATGDMDKAEALALTITEPLQQDQALIAIATAVAATGDMDKAEALALTITEPLQQDQALIAIATAVAATGDMDKARALALTITEPDRRQEAFAALVKAMATIGDIDMAEALMSNITGFRREQALLAVVRAMAAAGGIERAEKLTRTMTSSFRNEALISIVGAVAAAGDVNWAHKLTSLIPGNAHIWSAIWMARVRAAALAGDVEWAEALYRQAEITFHSSSDPYNRTKALTALVRGAAAVGDTERAERLARRAEEIAPTIIESYWRTEALTALVNGLADARDFDRAARVARAIIDAEHRAEVLTDLAKAVIAAGDLERARELAQEAEAVARTITSIEERAEVLTDLAKAVIAAGDLERARDLAQEAEAVARTITSIEGRVVALTALVEATAAACDVDHARILAQDAEAAAQTITGAERRGEALIALVEAM
jgi:tetratricopeptide (TPR) repeat protein